MAAANGGNKPPRLMSLRLAYGITWVAERYMKLKGRKDFMVSTDAIYLSGVFRARDNSKARW